MTWLFVPNVSTSSASAPEALASISASSWQFQVLAQSAWSRGKPSAPRDWFRRWKTAFWLQRLCGAMPEPSTADAGVDAWTASLAASRASRTPSPESDMDLLTLATSGPQPGASSSSPARGSSSSRTSPVCSPRQIPNSAPAANEYGETYSAWVSRLRADCSQRRKSARLMSASGSSSSGWPTPAARDIKGANSAEHLTKSSGSLHLDQLPNFVAHCWATPTASENSNRTTKMAPSHGKTHGIVLAGQACDLSEQWATPCARDHMPAHTEAYVAAKKAEGHGMKILPDQVQQWSTPAVADVQGGRKARSGNRSTELLLNGQAPALSGHLDPTTSTAGETSSPSGRKLNPRFVEMLMGWPPGWTNFACSETALSRWKQRMRSELSQFAYRPAPPPQPDLFG